jgi:hypothetical protein
LTDGTDATLQMMTDDDKLGFLLCVFNTKLIFLLKIFFLLRGGEIIEG